MYSTVYAFGSKTASDTENWTHRSRTHSTDMSMMTMMIFNDDKFLHKVLKKTNPNGINKFVTIRIFS